MEKIDAHRVKQRKIPLLFAPERFDDLEDYLPWCEVYELDQEAELRFSLRLDWCWVVEVLGSPSRPKILLLCVIDRYSGED